MARDSISSNKRAVNFGGLILNLVVRLLCISLGWAHLGYLLRLGMPEDVYMLRSEEKVSFRKTFLVE